MTTPTLTRADALLLLQNNTRFMTVVRAIKASQGYTPKELTYLDDHDRDLERAMVYRGKDFVPRQRTCTDFIVTLRVLADGTLEDDGLRDAAWLFPGYSGYDWKSTRYQKPLHVPYLHTHSESPNDHMVHLLVVGRGSVLPNVGGGSNFDAAIKTQKGVHFTDMSEYDGSEEFEAHIHLSMEEFNAL